MNPRITAAKGRFRRYRPVEFRLLICIDAVVVDFAAISVFGMVIVAQDSPPLNGRRRTGGRG